VYAEPNQSSSLGQQTILFLFLLKNDDHQENVLFAITKC
jgi:hypothetical protein